MLMQAKAGFAAAGGGGPPPITYVASSSLNSTSNTNSPSHSINSGVAAGASHLYLCVVMQTSSATDLTATCEGVAMTEVYKHLSSAYPFGLFCCALPGSDGGNSQYDFAVTLSGPNTSTKACMLAIALAGVTDPFALVDTEPNIADNFDFTINVAAGGAAFGIYMADATAATSSSWTNATEIYDNDSAEAQASAAYYINTTDALVARTIKNNVAGLTGDTLYGRFYSVR